MSTRSLIGVQDDKGTVTYIYCHFDGYPSCVGHILLNHYQDPVKVEQLMELGDLSILGDDIGEKHNFDESHDVHPTWCKAYGRDRGEKDVDAKNAGNKSTFRDKDQWAEFWYLFMDGVWHYSYQGLTSFVPLTPQDCKC